MNKAIVLIAITFLFLGATDGRAQTSISPSRPNDDCVKTLVLENYSFNENVAVNAAIQRMVDEEIFEEIKRDISGDATVPVYGIPVTLGMSHSDFESKSSEYAEFYQLSYSEERATAIARTRLPDNALEAYRICKRAEVRKIGLLEMWVHSFNSDEVNLVVSWFPAGGEPARPNLKVAQLSGAESDIQAVESSLKDFRINMYYPFSVDLNDMEDFKLILRAKTSSAIVELPLVERTPPCSVVVKLDSNTPQIYSDTYQLGPVSTTPILKQIIPARKGEPGPRGDAYRWCTTDQACRIQAGLRLGLIKEGRSQAVTDFAERSIEAQLKPWPDQVFVSGCTIID
jgi:hypothetical protein